MDRSDFLKLGLLASAGPLLGVPTRKGLRYRGVTYDTGTEYLGTSTRVVWTEARMAADVRAIDTDLHCNSVTVFGTRVDRLAQTATAALERGLQVSIQPRLYDRPQPEILDHLARAARQAERLRRAHRQEVILIIGCEYILFTPGIVPGETFLDRIRYLNEETYDFAVLLRLLNAFIEQAAAVARQHFSGRITYGAAAGMETVNWNLFDIVGLDYYSFHRDRSEHTAELLPYRRWQKPIMILEFGCCTYVGAAQRGGDGYDIIDWDKPVPEIIGNPVRSEREQADHIANMLNVFEHEGFLSASPYTFISPDSPYSPDPRYDLDMASFSLVKVIREDHADPASPYRWEPKQSFHAVARHNLG